jgi:hypothetical protein
MPNTNIHPVDIRPVRPVDVATLGERLAVRWISRETPAPCTLTALLARYRDLTVFVDSVPVKHAGPAMRTMDAIYDQLVAVATAQRSMPLQSGWDQAIEQFRNGVRV